MGGISNSMPPPSSPPVQARLFGGMAGFGSIFGLLLQVLLIFIVARLIFAWSQRRNLAAAHSYAGARPATGYGFGGFRRILNSTRDQLAGEPLTIAKSDYNAFERLLGNIQAAYSAADLSALRAMVTPDCPISPQSLAATRVAVSSIA